MQEHDVSIDNVYREQEDTDPAHDIQNSGLWMIKQPNNSYTGHHHGREG